VVEPELVARFLPKGKSSASRGHMSSLECLWRCYV